jgi:tetratricopeptide (TPR) repeat protein
LIAVRLSGSADIHAARRRASAAKGDYDTAIADYSAALKTNPRDAVALYSRGIAKKNKGDEAGGQADIDAAKQLDPKIGT